MLPSGLFNHDYEADHHICSGMVDGSGVLYDPAGLDRAEIIRLAKMRSPLSGYDDSKLSQQGYKVLLEEKDRRLPCE